MKSFLIAVIVVIISGYVPAQELKANSANQSDTTKTVADSLATASDSLKDNPTGLDTIIYASSKDSLIFFVNEKKMNLYGKSEIKYQATDLKSENILVDFNTSTLDATGNINDTTQGKKKGNPVLKESSEEYTGSRIKYNFKTAQGIISEAGTSSEGAYYTGEKIKKVDVSTYFIKDGIYTTCDHNPPHYYFYSPEMKVIQKKEIVAKWIWLYFGGVPFPVPLPFGVFPLQTGRRSGLIAPVIGYDGRYGNYLSHLGYFWAINDYMDWNLTADYYTRGSFGLNSRFRYVKRYDFSGSIEGSYKKLKLHESTDPDASETTDWSLSWTHHQNFTPTLRLDANVRFLSNSFLSRTSINLYQALENQVQSSATLSKSWESGNNMSISYSRTQYLKSGDISQRLPIISFYKTQDYPFKSDVSSGGDQKWYELFGYSYNGQFLNQSDKSKGVVTSKWGIKHSINGGMSPKLGYISISPNFTYQEQWYNKSTEQFDLGPNSSGTSDSIVTRDVYGLNFVRTFSLGVSASTKLYGIFNPHILGIASIRHTLLPSISYRYQPDFSKPGWGYYGTYINSKGNEVKYNKYAGYVYGGAPGGEQQSINFSLGNVFEMKTEVDPTDTTSKEKKIQLLNLNAGISYNFAADSLKFSDISVGYRTQVGDLLNISGSSSFTLYDYNDIGQHINRFLISEGKGLAKMTNFSFSLSTHLSGERSSSNDETEKTDSSSQKGEFELVQESNALSRGIYNNDEADFSIPWDISLNYNYNFSRPSPLTSYRSSNISANLNFNLTRNWKVSVTGSYDFTKSQFIAPQFRISRDLHAWIMNFTWNPIGTYSGYMLEIRVKAPQLSDLKVTKRDQFFSGR